MYGLNISQAQLTSAVAWANPAATTNKEGFVMSNKQVNATVLLSISTTWWILTVFK